MISIEEARDRNGGLISEDFLFCHLTKSFRLSEFFRTYFFEVGFYFIQNQIYLIQPCIKKCLESIIESIIYEKEHLVRKSVGY